ncbi:MAG: CYTH domain-containing protein [Candidatus Gracilibacteria bacterium]|nr:CYTH domain-containing protein [Candidatus Gracilibacteria bacterium]
MYIEMEKKYSYNQDDYEKIVKNCKFEGIKDIKDYYLDMPDYRLFKNKFYLRMRNGIYELKITTINDETNLITSKEIIGDDEIDDILKNEFDISIDETSGVLFIDTSREKYSYVLGGETIIIDFDSFQYGKRYEIEVVSESKTSTEVDVLIEEFRKILGLESFYDGEQSAKATVCARNQNLEIYEILKI